MMRDEIEKNQENGITQKKKPIKRMRSKLDKKIK
jgi:hypothetical protein